MPLTKHIKQVKYGILLAVFLLFLNSCGSIVKEKKSNINTTASIPFAKYEQLIEEDKFLADSILQVALDHEALYTLMGDLKPISSIGYSLSYPIAKDSLQVDGDKNILDANNPKNTKTLQKIKRLNRVLEAISFENYQFLLIPFKQPWKGNRNMQILICRRDLLDKLLEEKASFFGQWGFVSGSHPAVVLTTTEFENRNDRYRAYGYLFGYPEHAVNFFVKASVEYKKTNKFVKRSFFHIPVFAKEKGHFTYALPKDFIPIEKDSILLRKAATVLKEYKLIRPNYINEKRKLEAVKLYRDWWGKNKKKLIN